jgi:hypothetical protein
MRMPSRYYNVASEREVVKRQKMVYKHTRLHLVNV